MNNLCLTKNSLLENQIINICSDEYEYFLDKTNVVGIAMGYKIKKGMFLNKLCLTVLVSKKVPEIELSCNNIIPKHYKGITTDVFECGIILEDSLTSRIRPCIGGFSIGADIRTNYGTLGCLVSDASGIYILSCNHVLALRNIAPLGTKIVQPSLSDSGHISTDVIASLERYIPIKVITPTEKPHNIVDCAMAKLTEPTIAIPSIAYIGPPKGIATPSLFEDVKKIGRTTELTKGFVLFLGGTIKVTSTLGPPAIFTQQILTSKMSTTGDSGSILLNENNYALGLVMSSSKAVSVSNMITNVLDTLNVKLVTE